MARYSRRAYLRASLVVSGVAGAGCNGDESGTSTDDRQTRTTETDRETGTDEPDTETTPGPRGEIDDPPALLVLANGYSDGGNNHAGRVLSRFDYNEADETYDTTAEFVPEDGRFVTSSVRFRDGYAVTIGTSAKRNDLTRLAVLDDEMNRLETRELEGHHTVATDGDAIFTASEDGFRSFDTELNPLGEVTLPEELAGKHMEDVLVYDGVAYVVDNVIMPVYLFRVDVSDPEAPSYLEVVRTLGVNQSLHQQWLNPASNRWCVLQTTGHMDGGEQYVVVTPMTDAESDGTVEGPEGEIAHRSEDEIERNLVYAWARDNAPDDYAEDLPKGVRILDVACSPPVYATIEDGGDFQLASVMVSGGDVSFGSETPIDGSARVETTSDTAVVLSEHGTLALFDVHANRFGHVESLPVDDPLELAVLDP